MRLSVAIPHAPWVPERVQWMAELVGQLPDAVVVADVQREGLWATARRAWHAATGTHHLILQDDAHLCDGFVELAHAAIVANPGAAISFFNMPQFVDRQRRDSWIPCEGYAPCVALAMPTSWIDDFLSWSASHVKESFEHDDIRMAMWLGERERPCWMTMPSLVEHLGDERADGSPCVADRRATRFEQDPNNIDWSRGLDGATHVHRSHKRLREIMTGWRVML